MELMTAAQLLSKEAVKIRTLPREVICAGCGKMFTARSAKAQFCSRICFNKADYHDKHEPLIQQLNKIKREIRKAMGMNPKVDPVLKRMDKLILLAKMKNNLHLLPSLIRMYE